MMGIVDSPDLKGIIPNAFNHIFGFIKTEGESKKFLVRCSFVEIYNEEVRDLLVNNNKKLDIREDPKKGTFVKDLTYITLKDADDIQRCLDKGNKNRHVGATSMNDQSSRSHSLFTVYLETEENGKIRSGKLNLVDLAGSERVGKTNATGQTFDEGKKINLSLTALGSVIDALSFNRKHIPYKDSKLTRLLADSLGGNTKTVMFANISPASYNYEETVGTLRYASRAKLIKNAPKINEDPKDALLRKYEEEIKALKEHLTNGGNEKEIKKIKKKKKKIKKEKVEKENNEEENEEEENEEDDGYNDFALVRDDPEKIKLKEKLAELEKNLVCGKKFETSEKNMDEGGDNEEMRKKIEEQEEQNKKFREYREQQLKQSEEMEKKLKKLEEEKIKEEENLKNDVNKLQHKIKELNSEIEDLKIDNSKDRTDFMESVKQIYRNNQLYREIIRYLLTDSELNKIIQMSKYNEDEDEWNVQSFSLKEKSLALPTVNFCKNNGFGNNRFMDNKKISGGKQIIFQNYGYDDIKINEGEYNDGDEKNSYEENLKKNDDPINNRINLRKTKDKLYIDGKIHNKSQLNYRNNEEIQKSFYNKNNQEEKNNLNKIFMNQKEREKFEGLNLNHMIISTNNSKPIFQPGNKYGKIILNPLGNKNMNKFEASSKVSMEIPPIIENKKVQLEKIQEREYY